MTNLEEDYLILIADDEEDIRLNLCDYLELEGFETMNAPNGAEALNLLQNNAPQIIISDLMMPEMSGLELLEELRKRNVDIPVVIMTAFGTIDYAVKAMKEGAADFITKPIDYDFLLRIIQRVMKTAQLEQKVKEQQRQMETDLHLAGMIQKTLLPKPIDNPRLVMNYRFEPLIEIGGDNLTVHTYDEDHIAVALFDVAGHGVSGALVANLVQNELTKRMEEERPPFNVVEHLHRFVLKTIGDTGMFLTLVFADIDVETLTLTVCNAGHPDLLVWKQANHVLESIGSHVPAIGFPMRLTSDNAESKIPLSSGDRIILYTDGFPETIDHSGLLLGKERFKEIIERNIRFRPVDFLDEVFRIVDELRSDEPEDDRTLALVEIK
ncbi:MAG: SpoIIE family protein phosphatase [Candidatus Omnitrophota bacterium]